MRYKTHFNYCHFFTLLVLAFLFYSCEAEREYLHGKQQTNRSSRMVSGKEAKSIELLLKSKLNGVANTRPTNELSRNIGIEIDYTKILEVIDSVGIKNYTFLIKNHPEDDYKTFHNLIMNVKPTNELEVYLYKYMLTEDFALAYRQGLATMAQLRGKVEPKDFLANIDCLEGELITIFNPANPSDNDGGSDVGDIGVPGDGGSGGEVGGGSGGGDCLTFSVSWYCSCGASASTLEDLRNEGHATPVGGVNYTATMVLTLSYSLGCRMISNPCTGDGDIGILEPIDDECSTTIATTFVESLSIEQKAWWEDSENASERTEIENYIKDSGCAEESKEFAKNSIDVLIELETNPNLLIDIPCSQIVKWQALAQYDLPLSTITKISNLQDQNSSSVPTWNIQFVGGAQGTTVNMDFFPVTISQFPNNPLTNQPYTPQEFYNFFRLNLNTFVAGTGVSFFPSTITGQNESLIWNSSNPLDAVISINMQPDSGSVVCSEYTNNYWYFTTLTTP
jgi:hypothetical protein